MTDLTAIVYEHRSQLNGSEREMIKTTLTHPSVFSELGLKQLAQKLFVSESAIFRLCKKLGLSGFSEFRFYLRSLAVSQAEGTEVVSDFATSLAKANQELIRMFRELNLRDFYQTISQAEHVYIYSTGWQQQMIAQYLAHELFMVGKQAIVLPAAFDELRMSNVFAKSGDLLVIISFSGDDVKINTELTRLALVNDKFKYVALTNMKQNKLAYLADYDFYYPTIKLADHPDFPNGELAFGPAYSLVDLLVSGYLDWLQKK